MTKRYGWVLVCPKCYDKPGHYYGILKPPSERVDMACPNCKTRLVDVERLRAARKGDQ